MGLIGKLFEKSRKLENLVVVKRVETVYRNFSHSTCTESSKMCHIIYKALNGKNMDRSVN